MQDAEVEAAFEVDEGLVAPELHPQLVTQDDFTGLREEQRQDARGLRRELDDFALTCAKTVTNLSL